MAELNGLTFVGRLKQKRPSVSLIALLPIFMVSVLFGLVAVSASPILIAAAIACIVGILLLLKPAWLITLILTLGLVVVGLVPIWVNDLDGKAVWGVSILGFGLMSLAILRTLTVPGVTRGTAGFVWMALAFVVYATINSLGQWYSAGEFFGGLKRYFQVFGLMFAFSWLSVSEQDLRRWQKLFLVVALVQLPFALYELIRLVPLRETFRYAYPGLVPIDVVAGTLGVTLYGGSANGEMAAFLIIVLVFLVARRMEGLLSLRWFVASASVVLTPLFLGETKAVIVMLPLAFLGFFRREVFRRPMYAVVGLLVATLLTVGAGLAYVDNMNVMSPQKYISETLDYNIHNVGYSGSGLNRTTAIKFWWNEQGLHDPVSLVFGNGLGSSHDTTHGHLSEHYGQIGIGLTAVSTLLWDQGLFGTVLFFSMLAMAWRTCERLFQKTLEPWARADVAAIQASLLIFGFFLFYRIGLLENISFQIVFATLLGYLALLHRRQFGDHAAPAR